MARFLRDELALALSPDKTLVTHARIRAARYLGYEITLQRADRKITRGCRAAWRLGALRWDAGTSMLKTPAAKHKSTVATIAAKHKAKVETPHGLRTCFEARIERDGKPDLVARFGGIPLVRRKNAVLHGHVPGPVHYPQKELIRRLLKRRCELCGEAGTVLVSTGGRCRG